MLILASAPLLSASVYMTLGRIIRALDAVDRALFNPRWVTIIYVLIDIGSFGCQMAGSAMQASGDLDGIKLGQNIVIGGLGAQLVAFAGFVLMAMVFHRRLATDPTHVALYPAVARVWRRQMWMLYGVSFLIFVRSLFRMIEFLAGSGSAVYKTEVYLYVFDAGFMALVVFGLGCLHPAWLFRTIRKIDGMPLRSDHDLTFVMLGADSRYRA
jgi:hypothetical protein